MSGSSRMVPASSSPTSDAGGVYPSVMPDQIACPAASSATTIGVRTKRLEYDTRPSSTRMRCTIASPSSGYT